MKDLKDALERGEEALEKITNRTNGPLSSSTVRVDDPSECPFRSLPFNCARCGGTFHLTLDGKRIRYEVEKCYYKVRQKELFKQSGMPDLALSHTFDRAEVDEYNENLVRRLKGWQLGERGVYTYGDYGTGKTYLFHCLANNLICENQPVKFVREIDLYGEIKDSYNAETGETEGDIMRAYTNYPVLIIDDVAKQKASEWAGQILYCIIDGRLISEKPTFLTSNYSLPDLESRLGEYGPGITSRLAELCEIYELEGPDRRLMAAKRRKKG